MTGSYRSFARHAEMVPACVNGVLGNTAPSGAGLILKDRVDWKLLGELRVLDNWLQDTGGLDKGVAHALIGKYVYLQYLKDRDILSGRKLAFWGIPKKRGLRPRCR